MGNSSQDDQTGDDGSSRKSDWRAEPLRTGRDTRGPLVISVQRFRKTTIVSP